MKETSPNEERNPRKMASKLFWPFHAREEIHAALRAVVTGGSRPGMQPSSVLMLEEMLCSVRTAYEHRSGESISSVTCNACRPWSKLNDRTTWLAMKHGAYHSHSLRRLYTGPTCGH